MSDLVHYMEACARIRRELRAAEASRDEAVAALRKIAARRNGEGFMALQRIAREALARVTGQGQATPTLALRDLARQRLVVALEANDREAALDAYDYAFGDLTDAYHGQGQVGVLPEGEKP